MRTRPALLLGGALVAVLAAVGLWLLLRPVDAAPGSVPAPISVPEQSIAPPTEPGAPPTGPPSDPAPSAPTAPTDVVPPPPVSDDDDDDDDGVDDDEDDGDD